MRRHPGTPGVMPAAERGIPAAPIGGDGEEPSLDP